MQDTRTGTVKEISRLSFQGNIISHNWYKNIVLPNGKPDLAAIVILGDVVYWYKETIIRDEDTNEITERRNKFAADKLQKTYAAYADYFGLSNRQVKEAIDRLVGLGILTREFRNIRTKSGLTLSNVMYLEPVPAALHKIENETYLQLDTPHPTEKRTTILQNFVPPDTSNEGTCTDITTDITTEELGANAPGVSGETPAANAAPYAEFSIVEGDHVLSCVCGEDVVLKNLKTNAAECPHCHIGLYVYDADGGRVFQPPQGKRKAGRTKRVLSDLMPCQPGWENIPYYMRDKAAFDLLYKMARDDLVSAIGWAVTEYTKGKMRYDQIVSSAVKATQKRLSIIGAAAPQPSQSNSTLDELRKAGYTNAQIEEMKTWSR